VRPHRAERAAGGGAHGYSHSDAHGDVAQQGYSDRHADDDAGEHARGYPRVGIIQHRLTSVFARKDNSCARVKVPFARHHVAASVRRAFTRRPHAALGEAALECQDRPG
jgi:hypothetical protein